MAPELEVLELELSPPDPDVVVWPPELDVVPEPPVAAPPPLGEEPPVPGVRPSSPEQPASAMTSSEAAVFMCIRMCAPTHGES